MDEAMNESVFHSSNSSEEEKQKEDTEIKEIRLARQLATNKDPVATQLFMIIIL